MKPVTFVVCGDLQLCYSMDKGCVRYQLPLCILNGTICLVSLVVAIQEYKMEMR